MSHDPYRGREGGTGSSWSADDASLVFAVVLGIIGLVGAAVIGTAAAVMWLRPQSREETQLFIAGVLTATIGIALVALALGVGAPSLLAGPIDLVIVLGLAFVVVGIAVEVVALRRFRERNHEVAEPRESRWFAPCERCGRLMRRPRSGGTPTHEVWPAR